MHATTNSEQATEGALATIGGTLYWTMVGAALGFTLVGLFGVVGGLFWWLLYGDAGHALAVGLSFAMTGAAAGGVTGAAGRLIDGENPFARGDDIPPEDLPV